MINHLILWLEQSLGLTPEAQAKILASFVVSLLAWIIYRLVVGVIGRRVGDVRIRYSWQKAASYLITAIAILWVGQLWFEGFRNLATYLGLLSAGLAIALRDLIIDFAGWIFILTARPFSVGDRIQIGPVAGDVIDLRLFQFTLLEIGNWVEADQSTGRVVHIPNGKVFSLEIANYQAGMQHIWNEIPVTLTLNSDWKKAKEILHGIAIQHAGAVPEVAQQRVKESSRRFMIYYNNLAPIVYTTVKNGTIVLTIRYLCEPRQRRSSSNAIWEDILQAFAGCEEIRLVPAPGT